MFETMNQSTECAQLKGMGSQPMLRSWPGCVEAVSYTHLDQFRGYVKLFENHEKAITKAILFYHGQPDTESIKIMMGEVMTSLKNLMLVGDKDVLNSAAKAIEMGLTQLREFDDKNLAVTEQVLSLIHI